MQETAAYTSVTITFIVRVLLLIILYHVCTYTRVSQRLRRQLKLGGMIDRLFTNTNPKWPNPEHHRSLPPDDDIH